MKRRLKAGPGLVQDDRAQALVEFSFTIPIVLLFFFAILQYFEVVKASQLANYAAFSAARSFAVHGSVDGEDAAKETATKAAALAMAPVARLVPGEVLGLGGDLTQFLPSDFPTAIENVARLTQGYLVAKELRFKRNIGGGSVKITTSGNPKQVDVEINYPQPIYMPGLAELWALVMGSKGIHNSLKDLREGLEGIPSRVLPAVEDYEAAQDLARRFGRELPNLPFVMYPYVNVRGKCSLGFSDWGSKDPEYRPRQHSNGNEPDGNTDPDAQKLLQNAQQSQQAAKDYNAAVKAAQQACQDLCQAKSDVQQAQQNRDAVFANPNSTADQKAQADQQLADAQAREAAAQAASDSAQARADAAQQTLQQATGQSFDNISCHCN